MRLLFTIPRGMVAVLLLLLGTFICGWMVILLALIHSKKSWMDGIIKAWSSLLLWSVNVKYHCLRSGVHPREGALFIFNHTSLYDIPLIFHALSPGIRFGAKIELFHVPVFGRALRATGMLPIVRQERESVLKLYEESIARVKAGEQFALSPEGTRQKGDCIADFKSGPFIFAINGQFPIYPVLIFGAHDILPKGHVLPGLRRWKNQVWIKVLSPVSTKGLNLENRKELQKSVHELMVKEFEILKSQSTTSGSCV